MPVLRNARHETFAQEIAKGKTADEAYQLAGYKENRGNATRLKANESIEERVAELQQAGAVRAEVTIDGLIAEAELARLKAMGEKGGAAAAATAITVKAKLAGKWIDRNQHTGANGGPIQHVDLSQLDDDKFAQLETILGPIANSGGNPG